MPVLTQNRRAHYPYPRRHASYELFPCSPVPFLTCNQASSYRMSHHRTPPALVQIYHREIRHQTGSCRNEPSSHPTPRRCQWLPFPDVQAMLSLSSLVVLPRQNGSGFCFIISAYAIILGVPTMPKDGELWKYETKALGKMIFVTSIASWKSGAISSTLNPAMPQPICVT